MYANRTMKPVQIPLRRRGDKGERYIVSTYINVTMYPMYNYNMLTIK
jgi:hypothetical protein